MFSVFEFKIVVSSTAIVTTYNDMVVITGRGEPRPLPSLARRRVRHGLEVYRGDPLAVVPRDAWHKNAHAANVEGPDVPEAVAVSPFDRMNWR